MERQRGEGRNPPPEEKRQAKETSERREREIERATWRNEKRNEKRYTMSFYVLLRDVVNYSNVLPRQVTDYTDLGAPPHLF